MNEHTVTALVALRSLVATRNELDTNFSGPKEVCDFVFKDNTGMWAKAESALKAMDAQ